MIASQLDEYVDGGQAAPLVIVGRQDPPSPCQISDPYPQEIHPKTQYIRSDARAMVPSHLVAVVDPQTDPITYPILMPLPRIAASLSQNMAHNGDPLLSHPLRHLRQR